MQFNSLKLNKIGPNAGPKAISLCYGKEGCYKVDARKVHKLWNYLFFHKGIIHLVSMQNSPKNYHFLLPDMRNYVCVSARVRNVSFRKKLRTYEMGGPLCI